LTFEDKGESYKVGACRGFFTASTISIPAEYNGKPVDEIDYRGFENLRKLSSVEIPQGVRVIRDSAFSGCAKLKKVTLPESLYEIGKFAFASSGLEEIIIPKNVSKIGSDIFSRVDAISIKVIGHTQKPAGWNEKWNKTTTSPLCDNYHEVIWDYNIDDAIK